MKIYKMAQNINRIIASLEVKEMLSGKQKFKTYFYKGTPIGWLYYRPRRNGDIQVFTFAVLRDSNTKKIEGESLEWMIKTHFGI